MNNYEAATTIQIGHARSLILGPKPTAPINDSVGDLNRADVQSDIDETDE
jgi:hypothetical protein